jgi:hypothetical protein
MEVIAMNVLEKILEEIENHAIEFESFGMCDDYVSVGWVKEIIRKHMDDATDTNDGWILVEDGLPEVPKELEDAHCPEFNVTIKGAEKATTLKYSWDGAWFDDNGNVYNVIAWQPLPEPYKPVENQRNRMEER